MAAEGVANIVKPTCSSTRRARTFAYSFGVAVNGQRSLKNASLKSFYVVCHLLYGLRSWTSIPRWKYSRNEKRFYRVFKEMFILCSHWCLTMKCLCKYDQLFRRTNLSTWRSRGQQTFDLSLKRGILISCPFRCKITAVDFAFADISPVTEF